MYCPNCGSQNADTSRFCQRCGTALPVITPIVQPPTPTPLPVTANSRSRSNWWLGLLVILAIAVVGVTAYVVAHQNGLLDAPPTPESNAAVPNSASPQNLQPDVPSITPRPVQSATPRPSVTPPATDTPTPTPSPTPCPDLSPYGLSEEHMQRLGCPAQGFVASRVVVIQRFEKGVMVIFAKPSNMFDSRGGALIYALANDGRVWRMSDTYTETSPDPHTWYSCDVQSNDGPEVTGVPWRGFGKAWCAHPEVKAALGKALTGEEGDLTAAFQSYENGRAFKLSDWRGFPGWNKRLIYIAYFPNTEGDYLAGAWEAR